MRDYKDNLIIRYECIKKILIFGPNWIGDTVMSAPMVGALRKRFPAAWITIAVKPYTSSLWQANPDINQLWVLNQDSGFKGFGGFMRLIGKIKKERFDVAVILPHYYRYALISFFAKVKIRLGYDVKYRGIFLTNPLKYSLGLRKNHMVTNYLDIISSLGINQINNELYLGTSEKDALNAGEIAKHNRVAGNDLVIGIAPGAVYGKAKRWPEENYAKVADQLAQTYGAKILIFAGPKEKELALRVRSLMRNTAIVVDPDPNLRIAACLIKRCAVFISNDSGLMHIAAAVKVKTVAIFGSTTPLWTGPYGKGHAVLQKITKCSPCFQRVCRYRTYDCLKAIPVEDVVGAARDIIVRFKERG